MATITGTAERAGAADDLLLDPRHLFERQLEAEIAARHHHALGDLEDRVEILDACGTLDLRDQRHRRVRRSAMNDRASRTSSGVCTKLRATRSTPSVEAEAEVVDVLRRQRGSGQRHAGRVDALVLPERGRRGRPS